MVSNPSLVHWMLYLKYLFQMSEAHPDAIQGEEGATLEAYTNDLAYLKRKVLFTFLIFLLLFSSTWWHNTFLLVHDQTIYWIRICNAVNDGTCIFCKHNIISLSVALSLYISLCRLMLVLTLLSHNFSMIPTSFSSLWTTVVKSVLLVPLFRA